MHELQQCHFKKKLDSFNNAHFRALGHFILSSLNSVVKTMLIGSWISQAHDTCPSIYDLSAISICVNTNTKEYAGNKILASPSGWSLAVFPVKLLSHWLEPIWGISGGLSLAANVKRRSFTLLQEWKRNEAKHWLKKSKK